jgi:hypothetical protein
VDEQLNTSDNGMEIPADLTGYTRDDLAALVENAREESQTIRDTDAADMTDAQVDRLEALADLVTRVHNQEVANREAAAERAERAERAQAALDADPEAAPDPDAADPDEVDPADVPADEPADDPDADPAETPADEPQAVAAGGRRTSAVRRMTPARRVTPQRQARRQGQSRGFSLVASAEVGGRFAAGQTLSDMGEVAEAFISRSRAFPQGSQRQKNLRMQHSVATIQRDFGVLDGLHDDPEQGGYADVMALLAAAANERRLPGESLVAAGGWCAPSEILYGLTSDETLDGIINLPEVGISRGGVQFTPGPDFSDIYTTAGFHQTEAQAIAGTTKACVEVDCPDFTEVRLDAVGLCVKAPLLTNAAYPELVRRWIDGTTVANQHKVAATLLTAIAAALSASASLTLTGTPFGWGLLSTVEFCIEKERTTRRLSESESLEVVLPRWARAALRADLANRAAVGADSVTNAQLMQHFADRGAAVQYVLNWQDLSPTATAYPATVTGLVYPAGTFVKGTASVISLDTVYDTADLQTNVYTAAFVEDGVLLAKMKNGGQKFTVPVNPNGMMGSLQIDDNIFTAQAESLGT